MIGLGAVVAKRAEEWTIAPLGATAQALKARKISLALAPRGTYHTRMDLQHLIKAALCAITSIRAFSDKTGLPRRTLLRLKNESPADYVPTQGTLERVARVLRKHKVLK